LKGIVFNIKKFAIHDGPGIRTTVFLKGCPLSCIWCHNPESIGAPILDKFNKKERYLSVDELMKEIEKDRLFYDESGGGVTFSGGEPFVQPIFLEQILELCREREIHTAVDTTGHVKSEIFEELMHLPDLFLYDLKLINSDKHKKYTGVNNNLIKKHLEMLNKINKKCKLRIPLVKNITDDDENILGIINFIKDMKNIVEVNLLPFHRGGEGKLKRLNKTTNKDLMKPSDNRINEILNIFKTNNFSVKIGG